MSASLEERDRELSPFLIGRSTPMKEMTRWESPMFETIRMDAEVGSYQDDSDPDRDVPPFVREVDETETE
jgi:hypothetical protein